MPRKSNSTIVAIVALALVVGALALAWEGRQGGVGGTAPAAVPAAAIGGSQAAGDGGAQAQPFDATQLDPRVTQATIASTIGISGYTARVRPPESVTNKIKRDLMRQHGYTDPPSDYELDHFIPLGVGGSSNLSNLWLEPIAEAKRKDVDETLAHEKVTGGEWTLEQGQQYIRDRWQIHYAQ